MTSLWRRRPDSRIQNFNDTGGEEATASRVSQLIIRLSKPCVLWRRYVIPGVRLTSTKRVVNFP